jgi:hypothetical protein
MVVSPAELGPEDIALTRPAAIVTDRPVLSRQRGRLTSTNPQLTAIKVWPWALDGRLTPKQTGRLTVGRNITLTLT